MATPGIVAASAVVAAVTAATLTPRGPAPQTGAPQAAAPPERRPEPPPAPVGVPVAVPRRMAQDEIIIDIDENELEVVQSEFGGMDDEFDEFALMDRRQAVIETLQEEVELEDVSSRDAGRATVEEDEEDDEDGSDEPETADTQAARRDPQRRGRSPRDRGRGRRAQAQAPAPAQEASPAGHARAHRPAAQGLLGGVGREVHLPGLRGRQVHPAQRRPRGRR
jgi:hypothetical protein